MTEIRLRDYQNDFVHKVRLAYRDGAKAVLLVAATGAGKTVVFSHIANGASRKGNRVLILAHRDTLIKQASRKLDDNSVTHGIIMAAFTPNPRRLVQVASVQTLVRRLDKMKEAEDKAAAQARAEAARAGKTPEEVDAAEAAARKATGFDLIVIDEAHLSAAASYMKIRSYWPNALVLGVTGSPIRLDGKGLGVNAGGMFDFLVQGISIRQLIEQGYLVRPVVYASKESIDLSGIKKIGGDFDEAALADVMDKPKITGSAIEQWRKICPDVPAVAWCVNVAHAQHVAAEFNAAGIPAVALSGDDDTPARDRALAGLAAGTIKIITFAMLLVEGVDCPAIGAVILLRPTMSLSSYLQVIGRGLRTIYAEGMPLDTPEQRHAAILAGPKGPKCYVLDHADLWRRHGMADDEREWSLEGQPKKKSKKDEKPTETLVQCDRGGCGCVWNPKDPGEVAEGRAAYRRAFGHDAPEEASCCPACGHPREIKVRKLEHADGDLVEVTREAAAAAAAAKAKERKKEIREAKTLEDYERIGAERGYSPGWAKAAFDARVKTIARYRPRPI